MKISFANELARLADAIGADIDAVVADGSGSTRGSAPRSSTPGPGIGGSCLPEQAVALALDGRRRSTSQAPLHRRGAPLEPVHQRRDRGAARGAHRRGPGPERCAGRRIGLLGLAFKANTDDVRESPALAHRGRAAGRRGDRLGHDPRADGAGAPGRPDCSSVAPTPLEAATGADAIVVATEWPEYGALDWAAIAAAMRGDLVYDTRAVVDRGGGRGRGAAPGAPGPALSGPATRGSSRLAVPFGPATAPGVIGAPHIEQDIPSRMTLRARPVARRRGRAGWDAGDRRNSLINAGFFLAIGISVLILVGYAAW